MCSSDNISLDCYFRGKDRVEELTSTLFDLRKTLASLNYYVVPSHLTLDLTRGVYLLIPQIPPQHPVPL
jgi:hypothetical protein